MAGLNNFLSDTKKETVSLPGWYSTAQQNVLNAGQQGMQNTPTIDQTTAQGAINTLQGPNNPFVQGQNTLNTIATGAANPWLVDASGKVTPNTNTALGGLFGAQNQALESLMGDIDTSATAPSIASGGFGSKMNLSGVANARAKAFSDLAQKQMTSALQNQQTGVQAATGLGTVGSEGITSGLKVADIQQQYPFAGAKNFGNIVNAMKVPETKETQNQLSALNQIQSIAKALGGTAGVNSLLGGLGIQGGLSGFGGLFNPNSTNSPFFNTGDGSAGDQEGDFPQYPNYDTSDNVDYNYNPVDNTDYGSGADYTGWDY